MTEPPDATSFAFVCAKQDDEWADPLEGEHVTTGVMRQCSRCTKWAVAGYWCDTCGHEGTDPADRLSGHGEGKCEAATSR